MILVYSIILILLCVVIVGYPLFFERLRFFHLPEINPENDQEYLFDEQQTIAKLDEVYIQSFDCRWNFASSVMNS